MRPYFRYYIQILPVVIWLLLLQPVRLYAQEYSYTNYTDKDGLAGSVVHCVTQDKQGFLWFGTETGVSRFDGTHFRNFYKEDGLPDNEVIKLFTDSKGRVWMAPFKKSICYYYKNRIYNQENDTVLKKLNIRTYIIGFAEDEAGNIMVQEANRLHLLTPNGKVQAYDEINNRPIFFCCEVGPAAGGGFWVIDRGSVYLFKNNVFSSVNVHYSVNQIVYTCLDHGFFSYFGYSSGKLVRHMLFVVSPFEQKGSVNCAFAVSRAATYRLINLFNMDKNRVAVGTKDGVEVYDLNDPQHVQHFLPGEHVSNGLTDAEGNLWFCTQGQGVFRLNSEVVRNVKLNAGNKSSQQVFCFSKSKDLVLAGSDASNTIYAIEPGTGKLKTYSFLRSETNSPVLAICAFDNNEIIYGSTFFLTKINLLTGKYARIDSVFTKTLVPYKGNVLLCTSTGVALVNKTTLNAKDTVWQERATALLADNDTMYIGTSNGLFQRFNNGTTRFMGDLTPLFRNRIAAIAKDRNGILWIATYSDGIIGWKNGGIIARINSASGLTSNTCRAVFLTANALWVGTDKGLNKICLELPGYPVVKYTTSDGLMSDIINALYVEGSQVFVGTREGLSFFDDKYMNRSSSCGLLFTDITVNGQSHSPDSLPMRLPHNIQNIRFGFAGISYRSAGDIRYRYRLVGLDTAWRETRESFLSYPTLPSGNYELQVQAINKFDVHSKIITASFSIDTLLWERTWFKVLAGIVFVAVTVLLAGLIINRIRRREQEKTASSKRIGELEQLARKAQMNPHFIFNSLNSIQQYVMDADIVGANKFISGFSRLIRQTLDFSSKHEISLEQELNYLTNYLELEQTRLENAFSWSVDVAKDIRPSEYYIPPMILQPFVENSVRHGLRFRRDTKGIVRIIVKKEAAFLVCILEDNGIGRKAALQHKSANPIEYQSKGMSLTAERIQMLNAGNAHTIGLEIEDMEDEQQQALGTRVTIRFPVV